MCIKNVVRRSGAFLSALVLCFALAVPAWATDSSTYSCYTLADFSGSYTSGSYDHGTSSQEYGAGEFPLVRSCHFEKSCTDAATRLVGFYCSSGEALSLSSGDSFSYIYTFPVVSSASYEYDLEFQVSFRYSISRSFVISYCPSSDTWDINNYWYNRDSGAVDEASLSYSLLVDPSGAAVGMIVSGVALTSFTSGPVLGVSWSLADVSVSDKFTDDVTITHNSYSDFIFYVSSDSSSSGSAGDSGSSSGTTTTEPSMTLLSTQVFDTSGSVVGVVDGVDLSSGTYTVQSSIASGGEVLLTGSADVTTAPFYIHHSFDGLTPETEYTNTYTLYKDGAATAATASTTYTTKAASASSGDSGSTDLSSVLTSLDAIYAEQKTQTSLLQQIKDFLTGQTDKNGAYTDELEDSTGVSKDSIKDKKTDIEAFNNQGYGITEEGQAGLEAVIPVFSAFSFIFSILAIFIGLGVLGVVIRKGLS